MLRIAAATAGCLHPCCHFHFIFADEEKTSIVSSTNRSYSYAVLEPWESLNCLAKAFTGTKSSLQIYTAKKRKGWGWIWFVRDTKEKAQDVISSALQSWEQVSLNLMQVSSRMFKEEGAQGFALVGTAGPLKDSAVVVYPCSRWVRKDLCKPQGPLFHSPCTSWDKCRLQFEGKEGEKNCNIFWWKPSYGCPGAF